ncbi:MAG: 6-carboxytetrahydropterin synthase QueD [Candidatus Omnitrophica bacterium]|nr:6-carboxytetrahydropterin synthase QueD [Candidatus Omnitrophota bacterium]MDD5352011.1 6-carboxytetrahydropterin synthase QueD [Candidatus Omnitrophota bacterium]MDD5551065.1 6-carboxytetrahydropterin synthase QueD [Candidatus Omnitrophota bacterium]
MFEISIKSEFSSAHNLRGYLGKCESLHGHNWQVEAIVTSNKLDKIGMAIDFKKLKKIINGITEKLDHKYLNELVFFKHINPTSENIAKFIFNKAKPLLKKESVSLKSITVWESRHCKASYYE